MKKVLLEGTQLRRPLYSGRRNRSTLRNTLFFERKICRKVEMQAKGVVEAQGGSDVSNNCPGQAGKGRISEKTQDMQGSSILTRNLARDIMKAMIVLHRLHKRVIDYTRELGFSGPWPLQG